MPIPDYETGKAMLRSIPILTPPDKNGNHEFMYMLLDNQRVSVKVGDIIDMLHDKYIVTKINEGGHSGICRLVEEHDQ